MIWKYDIPVQDSVTILIPKGGEVLKVGDQGGTMMMWVLVDPEAKKTPRAFRIFGTGQPIPITSSIPSLKYLDSVIMSHLPLVWHVYEQL